MNDCTLDDARSALDWIPSAASNYDAWIRVGMALRYEFGDLAFDAWDNWSEGYSKYSAKECRRKWNSFKGSSVAGSVSIGYLFKLALDAGWAFEKRELTAEQKKTFAQEQTTRRQQLEAQRKREDDEIAAWYEVVAEACARIWEVLHPVGRSPYIGKKKVNAFGVRFAHHGIVIHTIEAAQVIRLVTGEAEIKGFFKNKTDDSQFFYIKPGYTIVPLRDPAGRLMNLQMISETGKKMFMRHGRKSGLCHVFGPEPETGKPFGIAEGYATAATAHMATGWPMAVAIDAGNLPSVAESLYKRFPSSIFFVLADDDVDTERENLRRAGRDDSVRDLDFNPGIKKAREAALLCDGCVVMPNFNAAPRVVAHV